MTDPAVIDLKAIESLRALNPDDNDEFLREITGIFIEDTPIRLAELDESLARGDVGKFTRAAHSIKGSSANLGAVGLRSLAEKLEHESRDQGLANVGSNVSLLKVEFERAKQALLALTTR